jgi:hypothetical protein
MRTRPRTGQEGAWPRKELEVQASINGEDKEAMTLMVRLKHSLPTHASGNLLRKSSSHKLLPGQETGLLEVAFYFNCF